MGRKNNKARIKGKTNTVEQEKRTRRRNNKLLHMLNKKNVGEKVKEKETNNFRDYIKVTSIDQKTVLSEEPQVNEKVESKDELSQFVTTVTQLTGNFEDDLYDVMVMYSNRKGSARFQSIEEYQKYQRMYEQLSLLLDKNKGNYLKSYSELIEEYPKDSDESLIIKARINRLIEKEKQNEGR